MQIHLNCFICIHIHTLCMDTLIFCVILCVYVHICVCVCGGLSGPYLICVYIYDHICICHLKYAYIYNFEYIHLFFWATAHVCEYIDVYMYFQKYAYAFISFIIHIHM